MKTLIQSKTFQLAVLQALIGFFTILFTELDMVGALAIVKSLGDVALRLVTKDEITSVT